MKIGKITDSFIRLTVSCAVVLLFSSSLFAQGGHDMDIIEKKFEDVLINQGLSDIAYITKVRLTGPAKYRQEKNGNAFHDQFIGNPLAFYSYVFIPRSTVQANKYPLLVFPHGGIHGTLGSSYNQIIREMLAQGYIVVAPDYRGSTGYGKGFYEAIDYGGLENEDVLAARDYMVSNYSIVDSTRVGLVGWSHGGMITLMNILKYPEKYTCGYAGVPVSDVTYRLEYHDKSYTNLFSASYHVGETPAENPQEYARRSPVTYAAQLCRPLMITTTENDNDVSVNEVRKMIAALKAAGKQFEYEIYPPMPGSHVFERIDSKEASQIRYKTYNFLKKYLNPPKPFKTYKEMRKAGYFYY
jgi:dipeptidyl aminopeptidase/acylaminoacyl peptidase